MSLTLNHTLYGVMCIVCEMFVLFLYASSLKTTHIPTLLIYKMLPSKEYFALHQHVNHCFETQMFYWINQFSRTCMLIHQSIHHSYTLQYINQLQPLSVVHTTNSLWSALGLNLSLCNDRPAYNCISCSSIYPICSLMLS